MAGSREASWRKGAEAPVETSRATFGKQGMGHLVSGSDGRCVDRPIPCYSHGEQLREVVDFTMKRTEFPTGGAVRPIDGGAR